MNPNDSSFRTALVAQLATADDLTAMRERILASITADQKRSKRQRVAVQALWLFCAGSAVYFAWFDPAMPHGLRGPFTAGFLLFYGAWEVLKQRIKAARTDVLREIKQLQLQFLELSAKEQSGRLNPKPDTASS